MATEHDETVAAQEVAAEPDESTEAQDEKETAQEEAAEAPEATAAGQEKRVDLPAEPWRGESSGSKASPETTQQTVGGFPPSQLLCGLEPPMDQPRGSPGEARLQA